MSLFSAWVSFVIDYNIWVRVWGCYWCCC